jgi:hypothetical protein
MTTLMSGWGGAPVASMTVTWVRTSAEEFDAEVDCAIENRGKRKRKKINRRRFFMPGSRADVTGRNGMIESEIRREKIKRAVTLVML